MPKGLRARRHEASPFYVDCPSELSRIRLPSAAIAELYAAAMKYPGASVGSADIPAQLES